MADDINSSASFGQSKNDSEELPIIVAQRCLNIFRQLHIFSDERREAFNKMLLELPPEVKSIFQSLPGGTPLQEYMEDLEQKSKGLEPVAHHSHQKNSNILQEALSENRSTGGTTGGEGIINGDNFARILASSLAQSNAEIIRELQNTRPAAAGIEGGSGTGGGFDGPMKLVADESFTNIISKALAEAIENSEKKRLEDNKMIARSFTELQENLTKLIEQSSQLKFISGGDGKTAAAPIQMKGLVDDLVKAQSAFLKETTKSQKEELSSIISTAIKESQKVSTQALIESFKKISEEKIPTPITYAASSPKGQPAMESVEQALKAQGKEFSSIISMALKESQKNSAQTIIETLETLKKDSTVSAGGSDGYGFETDDDGYSAATTADAGDGEDWEWEYEEVPADAEMSGEEGEDWEWEYEEVPADAEASGEEGEDWEWEYEEVPADAETAGEENGDWEWEYENTPAAAAETEDEVYEEAAAEDSSLSPDEFAQTSEIVVDSLPQFVLLGLEDEKFRDPYIENSDNIG